MSDITKFCQNDMCENHIGASEIVRARGIMEVYNGDGYRTLVHRHEYIVNHRRFYLCDICHNACKMAR